KIVSTQFDASTMNPQIASKTQMPDDGTGEKEIYRMEDFRMIVYPKNMYGTFFSGDSFVIQYTYQHDMKNYTLIYYWLGQHCTQDEQGAAALGAIELDKKLDGTATIIRVVQDKEPTHFMAMFHGHMIVFKHGKRSGFRNLQEDNENIDDTYLLQVRGLSKYDTKAVQVDLRASSLNSSDCFVLFTKTNVYIWCGKGSTGDEREMSKIVARPRTTDPIMVFEGQEKDDFWNYFNGGKDVYPSEKRFQQQPQIFENYPIRLYEISNANGKMTAIEIPNFTQKSLYDNTDSNKTEKRNAEKIAIDYLKTDPSHRDPDIPIIKTKQSLEPLHFTGFFGYWDREFWNTKSSYEATKTKLHSENNPDVCAELVREKTKLNNINPLTAKKYSYDILIKSVEELPEDVNPEFREVHLNNDEFQKVFKMSFKDYMSKPLWRQKELKKLAKLF
ncbi:unnamed protein product, partial [Didymodactylos carnosus]